MLEQAAGFAFLAALSPTALLVAAVFLGSAHPRRTALFYLIGAVLISVIMAIAVLLILHAGGLDQPRQRTPRYGVRLGLGILAIAAGLFLARRKPRAEKTADKRPSLIDRFIASPGPHTAFVAGLLIFGPSLMFIAAIQVIASSRASMALVTLALIIVVVINVMFVWLPLACYLIAPDVTTRRLAAFNAWLRSHGRVIAAGALTVGGVILIINGAAGLAS